MKEVRVRLVAVRLLKNGDLVDYQGETIITASMPGIKTPGGEDAKGKVSITNLSSGTKVGIDKFEKSFLFFANLSYATQLVVGATFELKKTWIDEAFIKLIDSLPSLVGKLIKVPDAIAKVIPEKLNAGDAYFFPLGIGRIQLPTCPETTISHVIPLTSDRETNFRPWSDSGYDFPRQQKQLVIAKGEQVGELEIAIEIAG